MFFYLIENKLSANLRLLMGFIFGLPFSIYDLIIGQTIQVAGAAFSMSLFFGIAIEYITTKVFKAPID